MDSKKLDREMNDMMSRLSGQASPRLDPYSSDPLSSDHLILNRSWEFFKKRIAAIEKQWQDISQAKADEIRVLKKEVEQGRERVHEVESLNISLQEMLAGFRNTRLEDYHRMKKRMEQLKMSWEEERVTLEARTRDLEKKIKDHEKTSRQTADAWKCKVEVLQASIVELTKQKEGMADEISDFQTKIYEQLNEKDSLLQSSEAKVELLKRELERRDQLVREVQLAARQMESKLEAQAGEAEGFVDAVQRKDATIQTLKSEIETMKRDKEALMDRWQQEKSEWRELWERAREVWKKPSSSEQK